ncbi:hypothetical protein L1049_013602 [Liquidambar formosana]|uniref:Uncharacterized protein n=1 Tax=Liquidambar formosana TaxID=63359 RepID=A0AAP0RLP4_LIQFO
MLYENRLFSRALRKKKKKRGGFQESFPKTASENSSNHCIFLISALLCKVCYSRFDSRFTGMKPFLWRHLPWVGSYIQMKLETFPVELLCRYCGGLLILNNISDMFYGNGVASFNYIHYYQVA